MQTQVHNNKHKGLLYNTLHAALGSAGVLTRIIHLIRRDGADSLGHLSRVAQGQPVEGRLGSKSRSDLSPTLSVTPTLAEEGPRNGAGLKINGSSLSETDTGHTGSTNAGN